MKSRVTFYDPEYRVKNADNRGPPTIPGEKMQAGNAAFMEHTYKKTAQ